MIKILNLKSVWIISWNGNISKNFSEGLHMKNNKIALITGCTSGIGKALSVKFAQQGYNLILVAKNKDKLKELSNHLSQTFRIKSVFIVYGLEKPEAAEYVFRRVQELDLKIDVLVNNAGFNEFGSFIKTSREKEHDMMYLHMFFVTDMMKLFLPSMVDNKQGKILNIGSTGSYISCPYDAVYAATKSYILSVSKGISSELKGTGVTITTLCPGSTKTEFAAKAGMEDTLLFKLFVMSPERVADIAYKAVMKRKTIVVAGIYKILVMSSYILPNRFVDYISKMMLGKQR